MTSTRRNFDCLLTAALLCTLLLTINHLKSTPTPLAPTAAAASRPTPQPATASAAQKPIRVNPAIPDSPEALTAATPLFTVTKVLEPASDKLLADTLAAVKSAGDSLHSIHVQGSYNQEHCDPLHHLWFEESSVEGDGVYEFQTSRARYHASSYIPTHDPSDEPFDEAFDGKTYQQVPKRYFVGFYSGPPIADPQPAIAIVGNPFAFPFDFATELAADNAHTASYLLYTRIDPAAATARRVILNDSQPAIELLMHYQSLPDHATETWYLDPDHGYALIADLRNLENNGNINWSQRIVYALLPAAPGIFYPQHAAQISGYNQFPNTRGTFTACSAVANEPHPDSFFTLPKTP